MSINESQMGRSANASARPTAEDPLLRHDLPFDERDLPFDELTGADTEAPAQLSLPGVDASVGGHARRRPCRGPIQQKPASVDDPLMQAYLRRLAAQGRAAKGRSAYEYGLRSTVLTANRLAGRTVTCTDLFGDGVLLGRALIDETAPTLGTRLSRWTLSQRRSAIRDFVTLMRPELLALLGEEPNGFLDRVLRAVAERVGAGYRLTGGAPRLRGGHAPAASEVRAVLEVVGRAPGYLGARNRAFFTVLAESGSRVNALRQLDGSNCVEMPSGRLRIFLREKGQGEPREVELSREAADALRIYVAEFNRLAACRRWRAQIRLGEAGAVWRNSPHGCWSYRDIRKTLRSACAAADVTEFSPHALRRAFATDAASVLPRHTVGQAGGWQGVERLDNHYVQPRAETIRRKLSRVPSTIGEEREQ